MKSLSITLVAAALSTSTLPLTSARADYKDGTIAEVLVKGRGDQSMIPPETDGLVGLDFENDDVNPVFYLCSLYTTYNGIAPAICQGWLSMALAAQLSQRRVRVDYGSLEVSARGTVVWFKVY